jgi:hypothetical protein
MTFTKTIKGVSVSSMRSLTTKHRWALSVALVLVCLGTGVWSQGTGSPKSKSVTIETTSDTTAPETPLSTENALDDIKPHVQSEATKTPLPTVTTTTIRSYGSPSVSVPRVPPVAGPSTGSPFLNCVKQRESKGNYGVVNKSSGAGGAYQFMPSTWNAAGFAQRYGVPRAELATPAQQDQAAAELYAKSGRGPWAGPGC